MKGLRWGFALGLLSAGAILVLPAPVQLPLIGVALGVAGGVYVGFALTGADPGERRIQWVAAASFALIGAAGIGMSPWMLAAGWLLHAVWDAWHHGGRRGTWVPNTYPMFCLSFDLVLAAVAAFLALEL